jgi:hypothetical protein
MLIVVASATADVSQSAIPLFNSYL